ncbi:hypothetical protein ACFX11_027037 [Malus domestica]
MALTAPRKKNLYRPFNVCSELVIHEYPEGTTRSELGKKGEDKMLKELAKKKRWRRCPNCNYSVERISGCSYIKCRCPYSFCYKCGVQSLGYCTRFNQRRMTELEK